MPNKEVYAARVAAGLCARCGKAKSEEKKKKCKECIEEGREYDKEYRKKNREVLIEYCKKYRKEKKNKCICVNCGKERIVNGLTRCLVCLDISRRSCRASWVQRKEKASLRQRDRYYRLKSENKCVICAQEKISGETGIFCFACAIDRNERERMHR